MLLFYRVSLSVIIFLKSFFLNLIDGGLDHLVLLISEYLSFLLYKFSVLVPQNPHITEVLKGMTLK